MAKRGGKARRAAAAEEVLVLGLNAVRALGDKRPEDVIRVLLVEERIPDLKKLLGWCAANRRAYRIVQAEELDRFTASLHHEGVCAVARRLPPPDLAALVGRLPAGPLALIVLDGVQNPNNLGAIVRVAAHFGAPLVIHRPGDDRAASSSAIARTAEGGAEHVELIPIADTRRALRTLADAKLVRVGTSARAAATLYDPPLPSRIALVLGEERSGIAERTLAEVDRVVSIPGTGNVESLNVSVACGVILAEHWRLTHAARR